MSLFLAVGAMWADVNAELTSKYVSVGGDATELTAGTWYALYNHNRGCYVSEETSAFKMRKDAIAEGAEAKDKDVAGKLFKLIATETAGEYYLVSGNGLYFDFVEDNASTVSESPVAYKIATIGTNAGHFYIQHATNNFVADGQDAGNNFVCYHKDVPTNAGGNNCYHFKPVRLADNYEEFEIVYNYTYGDAVKYTETKKVVALDSQYPDYPACSVALPLGVTAAAKPEGKVTANDTKEIALSVNMPFEYVESLDDYENLSKADEETGNWKWYHLIFRPDYHKVLYYNGTADPIDASKTVVDEANEDAYSWAFVGNPFDGFKVVNKLAGKDKGLQAGNNGGCVGDAAEVFKLTTSTWAENGFFMQSTTGAKQDRFNFKGDKLNYWDGADIGSTFQVELRQTEAQKLAVLVAEVEDLLDEYKWEHEEEPALGKYSTAGYEALAAAAKASDATRESIKAAVNAFYLAKNMPVFTIDGAGKDYMKGKSIFINESGALQLKTTDATDKSMLWAFDMTETEVGVIDEVVVRNVATGKLFWDADFIKVTETNPVVEDDGIFLFYKNGTGHPVHAQDDNGDVESVVTYWSYEANSGSAWKFTFVGVSNPAAYDLSEVKEQFATQAAAFAALGNGEAFTVLEDMRNNWSSVNNRMQELAETIEAGGLVLKSEVEAAMNQMAGYFAVPEAYAAYMVARAEADTVLVGLKDYELTEEEKADTTKLRQTVAELDMYFPYASSAMEISRYKGKLELATAPFYAIDEAVEGSGEVVWRDTNDEVIMTPDLSSKQDSYGGLAWTSVGEVSYNAERGVMELVAEEDALASLAQNDVLFMDPSGTYRLTGKAFHKGATNAVMFVGDNTVEIPAASSGEASFENAEDYFQEVVLEFTAEQYSFLNIGYRCETGAIIVGGFKLEKEEVNSITLKDKFEQVLGLDSENGFAVLQYYVEGFFTSFEPAYTELLKESVMPIVTALQSGKKVLKHKMANAIEEMEAMLAEVTPLIEYVQSPEYLALTESAAEKRDGFYEKSNAYALLDKALLAAMGVVFVEEEIDGEVVVTPKYYAAFTSVADIEKTLKPLEDAIATALAQIPDAITLDKEEVKLNGERTVQLTATVKGSETADKSVFWESDNEEVVIVDENGLVTVVGKIGTAYITAYSIHKSVSADCEVTVKALPTGIDGFEVKVETVIYDIHGRQVEKMEKGFYIVNGKKVLVK